MKRYFRYIKLCTAVFAAAILSLNAFAATFTSHENGAAVKSGEALDISFDAPLNAKASLLVDGKEAINLVSQGQNSVKLDTGLQSGSHTLSVIAYDDTYCEKDEISLNAECDVSYADVNESFAGGKHSFIVSGTGVVGTDALGNNVSVSKAVFDGKGGDAAGAVGFLMDKPYENKTMSNSQGQFIMYYPKPENYASGVVTIDYDLKLFTKCAFEIETKSSGGHGYLGGSRFLKSNGTILSTGIEYPIGEWMHIKQIMDYDNGRQYMYINDETIIDGTNLASVFYNLTQLKFQYYITEKTAPQGMALDNVLITRTNTYPGFSKLEYCADGIWHCADDNTITEPCGKIRLCSSKPLFKNVICTDVSASYEGQALAVKSAQIDEDGAFVAEFERPLPPQGEIQLEFTASNSEQTEKYFYSFNTDIAELTLKSVSVSNGDIAYYLKKQLNSGDVLSAELTVSNASGEPRSAIAAAAVYNANKLESLSFSQIDIEANTLDQKITIDFKISDGAQLPDFEIYLFDNFVSANALSKVWKLN